jgi:hypothetical protein
LYVSCIIVCSKVVLINSKYNFSYFWIGVWKELVVHNYKECFLLCYSDALVMNTEGLSAREWGGPAICIMHNFSTVRCGDHVHVGKFALFMRTEFKVVHIWN